MYFFCFYKTSLISQLYSDLKPVFITPGDLDQSWAVCVYKSLWCRERKINLIWRLCLILVTSIINKLQHRKCFVRIFIHSLQNFGKLTCTLRSLVRFPKFCNSWIKIRTSHFLWIISNLYVFFNMNLAYFVFHPTDSFSRWLTNNFETQHQVKAINMIQRQSRKVRNGEL